MILLQKNDISAIHHGGVRVVVQKSFKQFLRNPTWLCTLKNSQIPGMLAFFATVYQPNINQLSVCVDPELSTVNEFLFLTATATAMEYPYLIVIRYSHPASLRQASFLSGFFECSSLTGSNLEPVL